MTSEQFNNLFLEENEASHEMLIGKAEEYATNDERLENFKQAAGMTMEPSSTACIWFMVKHMVSIVKMSRNPWSYTPAKWDEKLRDIRNYTYLCKGCLIDEGIK